MQTIAWIASTPPYNTGFPSRETPAPAGSPTSAPHDPHEREDKDHRYCIPCNDLFHGEICQRVADEYYRVKHDENDQIASECDREDDKEPKKEFCPGTHAGKDRILPLGIGGNQIDIGDVL